MQPLRLRQVLVRCDGLRLSLQYGPWLLGEGVAQGSSASRLTLNTTVLTCAQREQLLHRRVQHRLQLLFLARMRPDHHDQDLLHRFCP